MTAGFQDLLFSSAAVSIEESEWRQSEVTEGRSSSDARQKILAGREMKFRLLHVLICQLSYNEHHKHQSLVLV